MKLRCIGCAPYGAVGVEGGADHVMPPRLPKDRPKPARASASPGASARINAAMAANKSER